MAAATKISVWFDGESGDNLWIVSADDDEGGTETLSTHETRQEAVFCGRAEADSLGLKLVECDRHGAETVLT